MRDAYQESIDRLDTLSEEQCRQYAETLIRMFASFTDAVDECVEPDEVAKVVSRWKSLMGRSED